MKKIFVSSMTIISFLLLVIGCGGGGLSPTPPTEGTVTGVIKNYATGNALSNVKVKLENQEVLTDTNGIFVLEHTSLSGRMVVSIEKNGFVKSSTIINLTPKHAVADLSVDILPVEYTGSFDPSTDFSKYMGDGYISLAAGSLVTPLGNSPEGDVSYEITYIFPVTMGIKSMPGDMTLENNSSFATYGAMVLNFKDTAGNMLQLASGMTADVRIPVASSGSVMPENIKFYYYDELKDGKWVEEGVGTLSPGKTYYSGKISNINVWSTGYEYETVQIAGCVQNLRGKKVTDAMIRMEGITYSSMASVYTDIRGAFSIPVMKNETSLITASRLHEISNTVKIEKTAAIADINISDCILLGDIPLIAKLTWGERPSDLDTHVIGPNDYHIWWTHLGNLFDEERAKLDVDDTTSYGPEVFTALSFPTSGVYHYAIYNYTGTHSPNITNSPARVEVIVNGETTVFTPPVGEGSNDRWWNVFDIIVDTRGNISITPVNTWATNETGPSQNHRISKQVMLKKK